MPGLRSPILVTGAHRSGTSWVGRSIAASPLVGYIHEPFNLNHHPGICTARFTQWFPYVTPENAGRYLPHLKRTLDFSYGLLEELKAVRKPKHIGRILKEGPEFSRHRRRNVRPLVKDPIAFFSSEWLAATFDMHVVMTIRHPAAFAGSLLRLGFVHPFADFLAQPSLMGDHLAAFETDIRKMAEHERPIVEQAALLWKMIYGTLIGFKQQHPDWLLLRHEDLVLDPVRGFQMIFDKIELPMTTEIKERISRNARDDVKSWKGRLSPEDIEYLREHVSEVSSHFYADEEW